MLKFKRNIFEFSNKSIFYKFFLIKFFIYIKISKNLSAKHYQENKERLQKKTRKRYQSHSKKCCKISQKMRNKQKLVEYRKKYYRMRKMLYYNYFKK